MLVLFASLLAAAQDPADPLRSSEQSPENGPTVASSGTVPVKAKAKAEECKDRIGESLDQSTAKVDALIALLEAEAAKRAATPADTNTETPERAGGGGGAVQYPTPTH